MMRSTMAVTVMSCLTMITAPSSAQATKVAPATQAAGVTTADPMQAINRLRQELIDSFNKGEVDRLLSHLDPDVVVTWQNAEVCRGPEAVRAYYDRMMTGPDRIVAKVTANPAVDDRHIYEGDWAVSWGNMHDHFELTDGKSLQFDRRFTATIARRGEAWKVTSFHVSINAFDNPILKIVGRKVGTWAGVIGGVVGIVIGIIVGRMLGGRRRADAAAR
jgi:ketosteroid isomerase-like protein